MRFFNKRVNRALKGWRRVSSASYVANVHLHSSNHLPLSDSSGRLPLTLYWKKSIPYLSIKLNSKLFLLICTNLIKNLHTHVILQNLYILMKSLIKSRIIHDGAKVVSNESGSLAQIENGAATDISVSAFHESLSHLYREITARRCVHLYMCMYQCTKYIKAILCYLMRWYFLLFPSCYCWEAPQAKRSVSREYHFNSVSSLRTSLFSGRGPLYIIYFVSFLYFRISRFTFKLVIMKSRPWLACL